MQKQLNAVASDVKSYVAPTPPPTQYQGMVMTVLKTDETDTIYSMTDKYLNRELAEVMCQKAIRVNKKMRATAWTDYIILEDGAQDTCITCRTSPNN